MATTSPGGQATTAVEPPRRAPVRNILDLPAETQREVFSNCTQSDLICLALVCKRFHELASAQLYRNFHIIFPDDDDVNFDSPIDGLAGGLDTFTTSDYNYAKHLKDLFMDSLSSGSKGELSYQPYLYSASCGKFLNTLLHLTLKRAHSLESFRWNIRVELSRPVYAQLHRIRTLKKVHIRLQAGDSYYTPPPPLPTTAESQLPMQVNGHWHDTIPSLQSYGSITLSSLPLPGSPPPGAPPALMAPSSRPSNRSRLGKRTPENAHPLTLSGFQGLKCLSVLDIDNLDVVPELKTCIKNSFSTLKELQLSFSEALAQQSRKPSADSDADDSDVEEDFQLAPASGHATDYGSTGPAKIFRAQEERKLQESILAKILGIEDPHSKKAPPLDMSTPLNLRSHLSSPVRGHVDPTADPRGDFIESIRTASTRLMAISNGSKGFSISQREILEVIEKAARKYVESDSAKGALTSDTSHATEESELLNSIKTLGNLPEAGQTDEIRREVLGRHSDRDSSQETGVCQPTNGSAAHGQTSHPVNNSKDTHLVDGDVAAPENRHEHMGECQETQEAEPAQPGKPPQEEENSDKRGAEVDTANTGDVSASHSHGTPVRTGQGGARMEFRLANKANRAAIVERLIQLHRLVQNVGQRVLEVRDERLNESTSVLASALDSELAVLNRSAIEVSNEIRVLESEIEELLQAPARWKAENTKQDMDDYTRKTRGMSIETLKICLVPVKASVLSQAIDIAGIRSLTLINVGNQAPIWSMLTKEQRMRPLALRSVFTDHVSASFLTCMEHLHQLDDLFMLERSLKHRPESFAPRSATSIDQIRRLVLKKHMPTLKRLMIKDESNGSSWDANEKTMILICTKGVQLEELAVSMNIHAAHAFMQYFSGLVSLRAINILHFRNSDTCMWVMREVLRFIVDNLSHNPELKLEWIAMEDDRVDRVVRPSKTRAPSASQEKTRRKGEKGKAKADVSPAQTVLAEYPLMPTDALDTESDSDDDTMDSGSRLRFRTFGPLQFYDVWGVKIFEKEIRSGKL